MLELTSDPRGVILPVHVQASARQNAILGERAGMLRVAVTATPEKGKANAAVVTVLSRALSVPKSSVQLVAGQTSPRKRFLVLGASLEQVRTSLA